MRRIWIFIAQLLVITLAFTFLMRGLVPYPLDVLLGFIGAFLVIFAISSFREAASIGRDLRLIRSTRSSAPPKDGERLAVVGSLKAHGLPLRAPFTRRECVYYRYAAVADANEEGDRRTATAEYSGLAMTRCLVREPAREIRLVGAPMFEGFAGHTITLSGRECRENAERYVTETGFEVLSLGDPEAMTKSAHATFDDRDGQVRRDVRLDTAGAITEMTLQETIVPIDVEVCALGTWSTSQAGLIQKLGTREILTLHAGGVAGATGRLTKAMRRCLVSGGISLAVASILVVWRLLA